MSYQKALERYMEATNTHDFENVQACLDTSAVYWFSDRTCKTLEEIRAYFEHAWEVIQDEVYYSGLQWTNRRLYACIPIIGADFIKGNRLREAGERRMCSSSLQENGSWCMSI